MTIPLFLPQVTRIPITGPAPYNTLVCAQAESSFGSQAVQTGKLSRWNFTVPTTFKLAGFDQRMPPLFDHSTTAFLSSIGPASDDTWLYAVDSVNDAGFNPVDGTFFVNVAVALMPGKPVDGTCLPFFGCFVYEIVQVTSFVLCYEPPPPTPPPSSHRRIPISAKMASIVLRERGFGAADRMRDLLGMPGIGAPASSSISAEDPKQSPCKCK